MIEDGPVFLVVLDDVEGPVNDHTAPIEERFLLVDLEGNTSVAKDSEKLATRLCATVNPTFFVDEVYRKNVHAPVNAESEAANFASREKFLAPGHAQDLYQRRARGLRLRIVSRHKSINVTVFDTRPQMHKNCTVPG